MDDNERLAAIQVAATYEALRAAMAGYHDRAVELYPALQFCAGLRKCLDAGSFARALAELIEYGWKTGNGYPAAGTMIYRAAAAHAERFDGPPPDLPYVSATDH